MKVMLDHDHGCMRVHAPLRQHPPVGCQLVIIRTPALHQHRLVVPHRTLVDSARRPQLAVRRRRAGAARIRQHAQVYGYPRFAGWVVCLSQLSWNEIGISSLLVSSGMARMTTHSTTLTDLLLTALMTPAHRVQVRMVATFSAATYMPWETTNAHKADV